MKNVLQLIALLAGAAVLAVPSLSAQSEPKGPPREGGKGGGRGRGPGIEMLTERLSLTPAQVEKLKPALEKQRAQMQAVRDDESLSPENRRAKMRAIRDESDQAILGVLDATQKKKFEEMRANAPMGGGRRGPDGEGKGDRPPPPPRT